MSKKKPVGEIAEGEDATHIVKLRLTPTQWRQLRVVAAFAGTTAAAFVRDTTVCELEKFLQENKQLADKLKAI